MIAKIDVFFKYIVFIFIFCLPLQYIHLSNAEIKIICNNIEKNVNFREKKDPGTTFTVYLLVKLKRSKMNIL